MIFSPATGNLTPKPEPQKRGLSDLKRAVEIYYDTTVITRYV